MQMDVKIHNCKTKDIVKMSALMKAQHAKRG